MNQFFAGRNIQLHREQRLDLVEAEFFKLGFVLDWLHPQRADIRRRLEAFDNQLAGKFKQLRQAYDMNRRRFDELVPEPRYHDSSPATFAWNGLLRRLVFEAKAYRFKKGDTADLCHAVTAAAFATHATLDKHWKRRVGSLRKPNGLAKIYYAPELDQLISDVEMALDITGAG